MSEVEILLGFGTVAHSGEHPCGVRLCVMVLCEEVDVSREEINQRIESVESLLVELLSHAVLLVLVCRYPLFGLLSLETLVGDAEVESIEVPPEREVGFCSLGDFERLKFEFLYVIVLRNLSVVDILQTLEHVRTEKRKKEQSLDAGESMLHLGET